MTPNDGEQQKWHRLTLMPESTPGEVLARAETEPTSPWYSGHFPGEPILPGIAQIAMVGEAIGLAEDRPVRIAGLKRVRFKQVIQPGDGIDIRVRPREGDAAAYSFQVTGGGEVACSGIITLAGAGGRESARPQR
ncbi:MAG: hypothetical protein AMJ54_13765 [Deltaproteobacteria bacterium SG8_13]|nr:MAG: hypothetical protein AMJ54_13765 [Deltaproteobacteria bacterium SG8_13]